VDFFQNLYREGGRPHVHWRLVRQRGYSRLASLVPVMSEESAGGRDLLVRDPQGGIARPIREDEMKLVSAYICDWGFAAHSTRSDRACLVRKGGIQRPRLYVPCAPGRLEAGRGIREGIFGGGRSAAWPGRGLVLKSGSADLVYMMIDGGNVRVAVGG
jgi:hypothetical protein